MVRALQVALGVVIGAGLTLGFTFAGTDGDPGTTVQVDALVVGATQPAGVDLASHVVLVTGRSCDGHTGGSGWYLGDGRIVTASHVVDAATSLTAQAGGQVAFGDLERMSTPVGDVTVAVMDRAVAAPLVLGDDPEVGDRVTFAGFARDGRVHVLGGTLTSTVAAEDYGLDGGELIVVDQMAAPGMSGGPVVDEAGRVVGVIRAIEQSTEVTLITPVSELWALLDVAADPVVDIDCAP